MADVLFNRIVEFEFGKAGQSGRKFRDLRTVFKITKTGGGVPNKAEIKIYNLNKDSRSLIDDKGVLIRLRAGYSSNFGMIFEGDVDPDNSKTELEGPDYVTSIEAGDGQKEYAESTIDKTFQKGLSYQKIFSDVAQELGLELSGLSQIVPGTNLGSFSASGMVRKKLDELAGKAGVEWSIQDRKLQIIKKGGSTTELAVLLDVSSGLIGIPKKKKDAIEVVSLLQPKINPGKKIKVVSREISGIFVAQTVVHSGDTHGQDFYTTIEAKKL